MVAWEQDPAAVPFGVVQAALLLLLAAAFFAQALGFGFCLGFGDSSSSSFWFDGGSEFVAFASALDVGVMGRIPARTRERSIELN